MDAREYYEHHLKYCPECGEQITERHPVKGSRSCYLHGDFTIVGNEVVWRYSENLIKRSEETSC